MTRESYENMVTVGAIVASILIGSVFGWPVGVGIFIILAIVL